MGVTRLPLELQQQVFAYLDTRSFHAARNVCKWWRFASLDSTTLARQLRKLPILPSAEAATSAPHELQKLWDEAAYTLMLGTRISRKPDIQGVMSSARKAAFKMGPRVTAAASGKRTVTINDRTITLFDTSGSEQRVLMQRPVNDLREAVGGGPWLKVPPTPYHEAALSSDGTLLAIAQERIIQIVDLSAAPDSFTVNEHITSATGHYICGLEFEQNDHVLRVRLSGKGAVLYLGRPLAAVDSTEQATIEHWKSRAGLRHVFLDSSLLSVVTQAPQDDSTGRVSGLQLLRPFEGGYLFAAQKHGGNESSHYIIGHLRASVPANGTALTVEPRSVTVLARLESFLSAWNWTLNGKAENGMGLWENMPSAHEHHPNFALSPDGSLIAIAERDKKATRPVPMMQLFMYRLPNKHKLRKILAEEERKRDGRWATLASFLNRVERKRRRSSSDDEEMLEVGLQEKKHSVARIPLCLGTIRGAIMDLKFDAEQVNTQQYACALRLLATTAESTQSWTIAQT
ncbi:hypothetical protein BAUCODRAFT_61022 [Baudoinia panamericana UAMH 10762]|uniref:F-box domain-containing protein n=1 Tax=Baudoinia panamericana (strain UAMH 10762) TaxID=717646 RepID=M2NP31_BAUPA|nr:uncharacterized protein BAUCODRAFT_61022 [Baudoinia panamericana UAMH 10762]EMD00991.1 hypothetical protein BAUCODRAFT_61022 [Baudoinia panamericana UAMH 10762]